MHYISQAKINLIQTYYYVLQFSHFFKRFIFVHICISFFDQNQLSWVHYLLLLYRDEFRIGIRNHKNKFGFIIIVIKRALFIFFRRSSYRQPASQFKLFSLEIKAKTLICFSDISVSNPLLIYYFVHLCTVQNLNCFMIFYKLAKWLQY